MISPFILFPSIDATLDTLAGSQWFSTLYLKSGYWKVEMHPDDNEKTAFKIGSGLWQFNVMSFGLCNAPATFECLMEAILQGLATETCMIHWMTSSMWPTPKDMIQLRSFLALCTYYRRFIPGFSNIARPLHRLTESGRPFVWTPDCQRAMEKLKEMLVAAPILAYPRPGDSFILDTDARMRNSCRAVEERSYVMYSKQTAVSRGGIAAYRHRRCTSWKILEGSMNFCLLFCSFFPSPYCSWDEELMQSSRRTKLRGVLQASCCLKRSNYCLPPTPVYFLEDSRRFYELLSPVLLLLFLAVLQLALQARNQETREALKAQNKETRETLNQVLKAQNQETREAIQAQNQAFHAQHQELKESLGLNIDATLDTLAGSQWFSTLYLKSGYWKVEMHPDDNEKTAFKIGSGLWQFNVMSFGLCNAPATFECLMEAILQGLATETCMIHLDDIIVLRKNFVEHLSNIEKGFKRLEAANLKLSLKKCKLFKKEVTYLGHIISAEDVQTDPEKNINWFSNIARPLHRLTESGRPFVWTPDCQRAMEKLKEMLVAAPILAYPRPGDSFILDTDANKYGVRQVTVQESDEVEEQHWTGQALRKPKREDRDLLPMINWKESDERPSFEDVAPFSPKTKSLGSPWNSLTLRDGVLYRKWGSEDESMNPGRMRNSCRAVEERSYVMYSKQAAVSRGGIAAYRRRRCTSWKILEVSTNFCLLFCSFFPSPYCS
ncbi:K02A2.6-like, partial [Cordylochernes scorpioides]